jgi:predicted dienelactone hydrolase
MLARALLVAFMATIVFGCVSENSEAPTATIDPATFGVTDVGPFQCGHRALETTYALPVGSAKRTIPVHIWYPTKATEGTHSRYRGIFLDSVAWEDAPLAPSAWPKGYPVLVHSHGHMGFAGNSARLMCHFASHGWVAVAPEHVGNTMSDTPPVRPLAIYYERPLDVSAALDFMAALPLQDPLSGLLDFDHVAASGHSFGTYTAWAVGGASFDRPTIEAQCASGEVASCTDAELALFDAPLADERAKVILPLAGGKHDFYGKNGLESTKPTVLLMSGTLDPVGADTLVADIHKVDVTWVDVDGGCHQLFGLGNTVKGGPECSALPDEEGFAVVNPWILAYARYHVLGERGLEVSGIVEGTTSVSSRAKVTHKMP